MKGNLDDILHEIDIEEYPLVQADFIGVDEGKQKKVRSLKKMEFRDEDTEFVFKARNLATRHSKRLQELNAEVEYLEIQLRKIMFLRSEYYDFERKSALIRFKHLYIINF